MSLHTIEELTGQTSAVQSSDGKVHVASYVWDTGSLTWVRSTGAGGGGGGGGDASAANQNAQISLETTIRDDTAISKGYLNTLASTVNANSVTTAPEGSGSAYWPGYKGVADTAQTGFNVDPGGALITRGAVTTDEGTFRVNFANTSIAVSIGTVTVAGNVVTGSGFLAADVNYHDYFKLDADAESAWAQIDYVVDNTTIILTNNYTGGASGAASRALVIPVTQPGGGYSVASGQLTITSGTTSGGGVIIGRIMDYGPLVYRTRLSISQRVANNETRIGFAEPTS